MASTIDRALDWIATGAVAGTALSALCAWDLAQRVAIRIGPHAHQRAVSAMARAFNRAVRLSGARFQAAGLEHVAPGRPYIVVSNHQSVLDISMTSEYLAALEPRYVSKRELARGIPGVSYNLAHGGSACIDRRDPAQAQAAIEALARRVRDEGWSVAIFPEGTRSRTGAMGAFRERGLRTLVANAPGVEVLPVTTSGGSKLFARELRPITRGVQITYRVHPPVAPPDPRDDEAFGRFVRSLWETIHAALPEDERA